MIERQGARRAVLAAVAALCGCSSGPTGDAGGQGRVVPAAAGHGAAAPRESSGERAGIPPGLSILADDLGPGLLVPGKAVDAEVAKAAGVPIHKSHVYDRMFEENPLLPQKVVDDMVYDVLLAEQARAHDIKVDGAMLDKIVAGEEAAMLEVFERRWKGKLTLDEYLISTKGVDAPTHRLLVRRHLARRLFRYYVTRFLALREDRVEVRIFAHRDRPTVERVQKQAREDADFGRLARRESEDPSRQNDGLVPPLSRRSKKVYVDVAFTLQPGEVSEILEVAQGGVTRYYLLYCVRRMPGKSISFADAKGSLDEDWLKNPVTEAERRELYLQLRSASEALHNGAPNR